ncbi:hypothetical protein B0H14DRAFT_2655891 [Mycena olivaceomarginata]|nr:hypothetical protein B0H14DRAFT_2655891 [Mycena olivaceomarginata]
MMGSLDRVKNASRWPRKLLWDPRFLGLPLVSFFFFVVADIEKGRKNKIIPMPMSSEEEKDPAWREARQAAVQRTLDMIHKAEAERQRVGSQGDWCFQRLPKILRANSRRDARALYVSRMPEYALQRAAVGWEPSPKWEVTDSTINWGSDWGENTWGGSASGGWGPADPAEQDPGFWYTPADDDISPILPIRSLPNYH